MRIHEMASVGPVWAALASRWEEIQTTFNEEVWRHWAQRGKRAEKTYDLMRQIIDGAVAADCLAA